MITFRGDAEVEQSPDDVFDLLADMAELDRWNPNVLRSEIVSGARLEEGARFESVIKRGPIKLVARSQLVAVDPGRRVEYAGAIGGFWSVDTLTFDPVGTGTRITFRNVTTVPRWLRLLAPLLNAAFQRQARRAVAGATSYLAAR